MTAVAENIIDAPSELEVEVQELIDHTTAYARAVVAGEIVTGELVRLACERHLRDLETAAERNLWFKVEAAEATIAFFPEYLSHTKGRWAGQPFNLEPWEQFCIGSVFGWKRLYSKCPACGSWEAAASEGQIWCHNCHPVEEIYNEPAETKWLRRFRTSYKEVARKNGKTEVAAGVSLRMLAFDDEYGAEVYTAATKADQARIPFNAARTMARMSPDLAKILNIGTHSIYDPDMGGIMKPISSDASYQDGLNPSEVNIDELHAHKTRNLIDVLETAVGAREQPLIDITTTAGNNQDTVCWDYHRYAENVLRGVFEDAGLFVYIASLDEGDKWTDPANYIKANPNLGVSVDMQNLLDEAEKAKNSPSRQDAFKQKKLNIWVQSADRWLDVDAWKKLAKPRAEKDLAGQAYCFGFDAAETVDFTAAVFLFEPDEDAGRKYPYLVPKFWLPEGALERRRDKRIRDQIKTWAREGWLTLTDGDVIDWDEVKLAVLEEAERFGAGIMPYDPYKAKQMAQAAQKVGIDAMLFRQGDVTMNEPCEEFERRILAGEIEHDGNPVLTWMIGNMVKKTGATGLIKPDRKKSTEKIDGGVGAIMALGAWMLEDDDEFYPDDYELMRVGNE